MSETIAARATVEPMLISERRIVTIRETRTEFSGMFQPGVTCRVSDMYWMLRNRVGGQTYVGEEIREWKPLITRKRPQLARGRGNLGDGACRQGDHQDGRHGVCGGIALRCVVEDLNKREPGRAFEDVIDIPKSEAKSDDHDEP